MKKKIERKIMMLIRDIRRVEDDYMDDTLDRGSYIAEKDRSNQELLGYIDDQLGQAEGHGYMMALLDALHDLRDLINDETLTDDKSRYGLLLFVRELENILENLPKTKNK
jgi:hypothetical protein